MIQVQINVQVTASDEVEWAYIKSVTLPSTSSVTYDDATKTATVTDTKSVDVTVQ